MLSEKSTEGRTEETVQVGNEEVEEEGESNSIDNDNIDKDDSNINDHITFFFIQVEPLKNK